MGNLNIPTTIRISSVVHLFRNLSKVVDEADGCGFLERVVDGVDVDVSLVEQMMEDVDRIHGRGALLLVTKYQVDPLVQARTHVVTLQGLREQII